MQAGESVRDTMLSFAADAQHGDEGPFRAPDRFGSSERRGRAGAPDPASRNPLRGRFSRRDRSLALSVRDLSTARSPDDPSRRPSPRHHSRRRGERGGDHASGGGSPRGGAGLCVRADRLRLAQTAAEPRAQSAAGRSGHTDPKLRRRRGNRRVIPGRLQQLARARERRGASSDPQRRRTECLLRADDHRPVRRGKRRSEPVAAQDRHGRSRDGGPFRRD